MPIRLLILPAWLLLKLCACPALHHGSKLSERQTGWSHTPASVLQPLQSVVERFRRPPRPTSHVSIPLCALSPCFLHVLPQPWGEGQPRLAMGEQVKHRSQGPAWTLGAAQTLQGGEGLTTLRVSEAAGDLV